MYLIDNKKKATKRLAQCILGEHKRHLKATTGGKTEEEENQDWMFIDLLILNSNIK